MGRWDKVNADREAAKEAEKEVKEEVKEEVKPEAEKPVSGFKCCRCGNDNKIIKNGNAVCGACFAPIEWKA